MNEDVKISLKKQTIWNTTGNIVYLAALWLLTVITTHSMGYEAVGTLTLAMAIGNVIALLQMYGVRGFQSSDVTYKYSSKNYVLARFLTVICGICIAIVLCHLLGYPRQVRLSIIFFVLIKTSESFSDVLFGNDQRVGHLEIAGYSMLIRGVILTGLFAFGAWSLQSLNAAMSITAIGVLALTFCVDLPLHNKIIRKCDRAQSNEIYGILKECFPLFLTTLIPAVITAFPRVILDRFFKAQILGYYGNISTPALLLTTVIPTVLTALLPGYGYAVEKHDFNSILKTWLLSMLGTVLITGICIFGAVLLGRPVLSFVYTEQILPYFHYLYYVLIAMMMYAITMCCNTLLIPLGKKWGLTLTSVLALVVCLVMSSPLIRSCGIGGAIAALALAYGIQALIQIIWIVMIYHHGRMETANETNPS